MNVKLTAVKPMRYGDRSYQSGETFLADKKLALVLVASGLAVKGSVDLEDEEITQAARAPRRRKGYRRRDLVAESSPQ